MTVFQFPLITREKRLAPLVAKGDKIKKGQCLAEPSGFIGSKIHTSISGVVVDITPSEISVQGEYDRTESYQKIPSEGEIWEYAYEAGIVGAGGAGFPTHIKLQNKIPGGYIIANGIECEPGLAHNVRLLEENPDIVIEGIHLAMEATGATSAYLGIKAKHSEAIHSAQKSIDRLGYSITIFQAQDIYPMGEERALIHAIFGKWIGPKDLTTTLNCTVLNVETLANLARAVKDKKPVIEKDFTVIGDFLNKEHSTVFLGLPIGLPLRNIIKDFSPRYPIGETIVGGPYTGSPQDLDTAYLKKIDGGVFLTIPLPEYTGNLGLLICACGGNEKRLRDIASKMHSNVVGSIPCKNVAENGKCQTPGQCPGQVQAVLYLKSKGAQRILMSNCNDCSNTVMACAPKMGIGVYHETDHLFRTIHYPLSRRMKVN